MICSKCGAECKDTQKFCMKCGNLLHAEQEMDDMQEELANSVGELMDGFDDDVDDDGELEDFRIELEDFMFEEEAKRVQKELQVDQIYSGRSRSRTEEEEPEEWEYDEDKLFDDMQMENMIEEEPEQKKPVSDTPKKKKPKNKKKIAITCGIIVAVLALAIGGGVYLLNNIHFNLTSFDDYYRMASKEYKREDYKIAQSDALAALKKAQSAYDKAASDSKKNEAKEDLIQVRKLLNDIYEKTEQINDTYAENLSELVKLDTSLADYFVKLAKYYSENKPPKVLTDFLRTVEDDNEKVEEALKDYIVPVPTADREPGNYTEQFAVTLTCQEGQEIWYTVDGQDPSTYGVRYTEPIKITAFRTPEDTNEENGVTVLKAITINADKVESKVVEFKYEIVLASGEPVVTPDSGVYTEYTEIKVSVPEGSKCYYTIGEGDTKPQDPDATSNLYIADEKQFLEVYGANTEEKFEPLQMPRGTHIMKFVIIDEYGIVSDVAVRSYNLEIPRNVTLNEAEEKVSEFLVKENLVNAEGRNSANHLVSAEWEETILIDNDEYYVIYAVERDDNQTEISRTMYLVDSYDENKEVIKDAKYENGQYILPEEEEETTAP